MKIGRRLLILWGVFCGAYMLTQLWDLAIWINFEYVGTWTFWNHETFGGVKRLIFSWIVVCLFCFVSIIIEQCHATRKTE